jgi:O-antigen/teichoic acid export membrane protein
MGGGARGRPDAGAAATVLAAGGELEGQEIASRAAGATAWSVSSMGGIMLLRFAANLLLARIFLPSQFGTIGVLRTILIGIELFSDIGIKNSVIYHRRGADAAYLHTAWTVQIVRGFVMWGLCWALARPATEFYADYPELLWLLPVAGLEAINNGFTSAAVYVQQRGMRMRLPLLLEWVALSVNLLVSIVWALIDHSTVWPLVMGPVAGGLAKVLLSHWMCRAYAMRWRWEREAVADLVRFGKWVFLGTAIVFFAQQFDRLYLGKVVPKAIFGVYTVAWNFLSQSSRPLTVVANNVLVPLFAHHGRVGPEVYRERSDRAMDHYLPFCLLVCLPIGLVCPALFGYGYPRAFVDGGYMGLWISIVVWFMILQQVPRTALLAVGGARRVTFMSGWNALVTVAGVIAGWRFGERVGLAGVRGLIVGNALGNLAGCAVGAWAVRKHGLRLERKMAAYSAAFLALLLAGDRLTTLLASGLARDPLIAVLNKWLGRMGSEPLDPARTTEAFGSLVVTLAFGGVLAVLVWRTSVRSWLADRRAATREVP